MQELPRDINQARRQADRYQRALRMSAQGYTFRADEDAAEVYLVDKPDGTVHCVQVQIPACSCVDFQKHEEPCKHIHFVNLELENAQQVLEYEERVRNAGVSPNMLPADF